MPITVTRESQLARGRSHSHVNHVNHSCDSYKSQQRACYSHRAQVARVRARRRAVSTAALTRRVASRLICTAEWFVSAATTEASDMNTSDSCGVVLCVSNRSRETRTCRNRFGRLERARTRLAARVLRLRSLARGNSTSTHGRTLLPSRGSAA